MRGKGVLHVIGARFEDREQIAVAPLEILEHIGQLAGRRLGIERQDPVDDVIRPCLVGGIEITRFGRRFEWAHHDSRGIGAQIQRLAVEKLGR